MQQTHRESHAECERFPLAPTQIQCDIAAMSFSILSGLDEILQILVLYSPIILVCLVAIILILARGRQLPWTALCGFVILLIWPFLNPIVWEYISPNIVETFAPLDRWQLRDISFNLIYAYAFGCLLHAFLRMAKRPNPDVPESSGG
jgi:hypothetical protein